MLFATPAAAFTDLEQFHHYENAANYGFEQKYVNGYEDGTVKLDVFINRAEFLKVALTTAEIEITGKTNCFPDVKKQWFANYVCEAKELGIIDGFPDGYFYPERNINFAETSKIMAHLFTEDLLKKVEGGTDLYVAKSDTVWFQEYAWLLSIAHVIPSTIDDFSRPITRGEAFQILFLLLDDFSEFEEPPVVELDFDYYNNEEITFFTNPKVSYYAKDGAVYFKDYNTITLLEEADINTFELLPLEYAMDKDHIFNKGKIIDDSTEYGFELLFFRSDSPYDLTSTKYEPLSYTYAISDKGEVLCMDYNQELHLLSEDADNVQMLNSKLKDSENLFSICKPVELEVPVDMASLEYISSTYNSHPFLKDKDNIFKINFDDDRGILSLQATEGLDRGTFGAEGDYAWDKDAVYYKDRDYLGKEKQVHEVIEADPATFEYLDGHIAKDKDNIYWFGKKFDKVDVSNVEVLSWSCLKDDVKVYCSFIPEMWDANLIHEITDVDVATFEKVPDSYFFKDKNNYFEMVYDWSGITDTRMEVVLDGIF